MASSRISGQDKDCASYLLSLKHRVSPTMTEDDMNMIIERTSSSCSSNSILHSQSSERSTSPSTGSSSFMSVTIPEPLFRTEEEISPNAVTICQSGTHFSLPRFGGGNTSSFGSYFSSPLQPHKIQDQEEQPAVLLPKLKGSKKKSRSKPSTDSHDQYSSDNKNLAVLDLSNQETLCTVVGDSPLVDVKDGSFIPDYIFLSIAQLQPCFVTGVDRVGTYKNRKLGFKGMSCKHCGGEPGFGRYFPETLRSLSQTTTSQTIVKHVAYKCRKTPKDIKVSVRVLKEQQDAKDQVAKEYRRSRFEERPKYGSRKVFFQRLWSRLHDDIEPQPVGKKGKKYNQGKKHSKALPSPTKGARKAIKGKKSAGRRSTDSDSWVKEGKDQGEAMHQTDCNSNTQFEKSPRKRIVSYSYEDYGENLPPAALKAE